MTGINKRQNQSAVYSFKSKWLEPLKNGKVRVFFRKRVPRETPKRVYFYVGAPISKVIGWADVLGLQRVASHDALGMINDGAIDRSELSFYLEGSQTVGVFRLGTPQLFARPLSVSDVRHIFNFHSPQNFVQISEDVALKMDELAN